MITWANQPSELTPETARRFREILETSGWPTRESVGGRGIDAAFRLVQKATTDIPLQDLALQKMFPVVGVDIYPRAFAYLNDDVELAKGNVQQVGSHFETESGKVRLVGKLDGRTSLLVRAQLCLPSIEDDISSVQRKLDQGWSLESASMTTSDIVMPPLSNLALRAALLRMRDKDQAVRREWRNSGSKSDSQQAKNVLATDAQHLLQLLDIFRSHKFPTGEEVGIDGIQAMFLLLQHSESLTLMESVKPKLKALVDKQQFSRANYALFVDRILVMQNKLQLYGTQLSLNEDGTTPLPIADTEHG